MVTTIPKKIALEKGTLEWDILLNNVTATTTSREVQIMGAKKVSLRFKRSNHSAGSSAFSVETTLNGTDWFTYNLLIDNVANTNVQNITRVSGKTLASDTEAQVSLDLNSMAVMAFRVVVTETTDGTHYAEFLAEY